MAVRIYEQFCSTISTMNSSDECVVDQKMVKSEFHKPVDKPLDLKQSGICNKSLKHDMTDRETASRVMFNKESYPSDENSSNYRLNYNHKTHAVLRHAEIPALIVADSSLKKVTVTTADGDDVLNGSNHLEGNFSSSSSNIYASQFLTAQPYLVHGGGGDGVSMQSRDSSADRDSTAYPASMDLTALYNSGFFQLQTVSDATNGRSVVVEECVTSDGDTSANAARADNHECSLCHKPFNNKHNLAKHMNLHSGVEKYSCSVCQKKFSEKGNMTKHMNIHTGSKTYTCPVCNKVFFWLSSLSKHKAIHSGERVGKYECSVCKKAFGEKGNLTKHMNVHTGNRMFACDVCHKGFYWKSSLIMHRTIHTGHKMYACPTCDRRFRWKTSFNKHVSAHLEPTPAN